MATDDQQILVAGTSPVPATWKVPGNGQITPRVVAAHFNGAGAGSPFYPTLKIISDAGVPVGIFPTDTTVAAGASADVTWFPGVSASLQTVLPLPGQILSTYAGLMPLVNFTTNSVVYVQTNFPTNTTFTKSSATSAIHIIGTFDFTSGASPDTLFAAVFIDGANAEATGIQISQAGSFCTALVNTVRSTGRPTDPVLAAGNHTIWLATACNAGVNFTVRTSTSVDLTVIEFEPSA